MLKFVTGAAVVVLSAQLAVAATNIDVRVPGARVQVGNPAPPPPPLVVERETVIIKEKGDRGKHKGHYKEKKHHKKHDKHDKHEKHDKHHD
jgi:hypothetical protein